MSKRAKPLPPDERRAALISATLSLISESGPDVSTKQIAHAAGVAEGTIFGVFPDKGSLISAAVVAAFDPAPVVERLASLDPEASFEDRVLEAVGLLQERIAQVHPLIMAFRMHESAGDRARVSPPSHAPILEALADVLRRDAHRLRRSPEECARLLRLMVFAGSHPRITDDNPLSASEIVDLLLHGIANADAVAAPASPLQESLRC